MPSRPAIPSLLERIGATRPGARLPSVRRLGAELDVSQARLKPAIVQLIGAGVLRREGYKLFRTAEPPPDRPTVIHVFGDLQSRIDFAAGEIEAAGGESVAHLVPEGGRLRKLLLALAESPPDGILIWQRRELDLLEHCERHGIAVIVCGDRWPGHSHVSGDPSRVAQLAVEHLADLGHRRLAMVTHRMGSFPGHAAALGEAFRAACAESAVEEAGGRIETFETGRELRAAWKRLVKERATGIVASAAGIVRRLLELASATDLSVPADLSMISLKESADAARCDPPLTTVGLDDAMMARIAVSLLREEIQAKAAPGGHRLHRAVVCEPVLRIRGSTAAPPRKEPNMKAHVQKRRWPDDEAARRSRAGAMNAQVHTDLGSAPAFHPLDLADHVNRALGPRCSWLGDYPLKHFQAGHHTIHGVPFIVAAGESNKSAIVLRSRQARKSAGVELPLAVEIPIGRKAREVFLLHAAGWTTRHEAFARYEFLAEDGTLASLDVIPLGKETTASRRAAALVQDWHPNYPVLESPLVLPYQVTADGDPFTYERYLYPCRWKNPRPDIPLRTLRIRSLRPTERPTLAVLAITLGTPAPS